MRGGLAESWRSGGSAYITVVVEPFGKTVGQSIPSTTRSGRVTLICVSTCVCTEILRTFEARGHKEPLFRISDATFEATEPADEGDRVLCFDKEDPEPERVSPGNHEGVTAGAYGAAPFSDFFVTEMDLER